jgi:hypothetical protein
VRSRAGSESGEIIALQLMENLQREDLNAATVFRRDIVTDKNYFYANIAD